MRRKEGNGVCDEEGLESSERFEYGATAVGNAEVYAAGKNETCTRSNHACPFPLAPGNPHIVTSLIMPKKKSAGYTMFVICSILSAPLIIFEPEQREPTEAEKRWGTKPQTENTFAFIRGARYYILGVGTLGLLIAVDDKRTAARKAARQKAEADKKSPTPRLPFPT